MPGCEGDLASTLQRSEYVRSKMLKCERQRNIRMVGCWIRFHGEMYIQLRDVQPREDGGKRRRVLRGFDYRCND